MKCPKCYNRARVTHSRDLGEVIVRRRVCDGCGYVMKTAERYDWVEILETIQSMIARSTARTEETL